MKQGADKAVMRKFGDAVRRARAELDISQEELAARADLHRTYVGDVERGARNIGLVNICRIAKALKVDPGKLLKGIRV